MIPAALALLAQSARWNLQPQRPRRQHLQRLDPPAPAAQPVLGPAEHRAHRRLRLLADATLTAQVAARIPLA